MRNSWENIRFGSLGKSYSGLSGKTKDDFGSGSPYIPYLRIFEKGKIDISRLDSVKIPKTDKQNKVRLGDIFFTTSSETTDEVGMTSVLLENPKENTYLNSFCFGFRLYNFDVLDPDYASHLFRSDKTRKTITLLGQGSTRYNLPKTILFDKLYIEIPSIKHQRKITKILNTADAVIEKTEAAIAKYKAIKQGMMQDLFTRGIDLQTGQLRPAYKDAPHLYKETELGWIPWAWELEKLDHLTIKIIDGTHHTPTYTETGVPFLRVTDVQTKTINFDRIKYVSSFEHKNLIKRCNPEEGDILYSKNGTIGIPKIVDWDWSFSIFVSLALIKPLHNKINNQFLASLLEEEVIWKQIRKRTKQGTVANLHLEEIREFLIPLPIMKEQKEIALRYLSIQRKIENEQSNLAKHISLKKGLMQDLLTGKVEVDV